MLRNSMQFIQTSQKNTTCRSIPFFLDGVAANTKLNQPDGMHPTAAGVAMIVEHILPAVEAFLGAIHEQKG